MTLALKIRLDIHTFFILDSFDRCACPCALAPSLLHLHKHSFDPPACAHFPLLCSCGPREVDKHPVLSLAGYKPLCSTPSLPDRPSPAHPCMVSPDLAWISLRFHWRRSPKVLLGHVRDPLHALSSLAIADERVCPRSPPHPLRSLSLP